MRTPGSPAELERRRQLAVLRVREGYSPDEIAECLGVDPRSVRRWLAAVRGRGMRALQAKAGAGRPPKLDRARIKVIHRWLAGGALEHGFDTELWTAHRLVQLVRHTWNVRFNPRYFCRWLRSQGYTPQKPERVPRERDARVIATGRAET